MRHPDDWIEIIGPIFFAVAFTILFVYGIIY